MANNIPSWLNNVPPGGTFSAENPYEARASTSGSPPVVVQQPPPAEPLILPADVLEMHDRIDFVRNRIIRQSHFVATLGFRLRPNYQVKDIEELLYEAGALKRDTKLTPDDLKSEQLAAWLREFNLYLPGSPALLPTGNLPPRVASRTIQIPSRLGYTSPTITSFLMHHLTPLFPGHPEYPEPGERCSICYDPYSAAHEPILITNCSRCRGHMFGYICLRKWISSGRTGFNQCPVCRTMWFRKRRYELRRIERQWREIEEREEEAIRREEEAFGVAMVGLREDMLRTRARRVLVEGVLVAGGVAGWALRSGAEWFRRGLGY
ncbi:hypothetical protein K458DRAFT_412938 [Lentithecium fluviatile CBS 122367]|uniref:RING-type domain-containing protein n=1 Tax=Lentithecium fluviatile CBS 122367 TaxID=1168545 RepID=A0A6G1JIY9_9PLEO|nr:hypothetical protein K458DRAFT_412938 [Lentithecium fluviatile CBS 122367]